jgi:hypothetical protein
LGRSNSDSNIQACLGLIDMRWYSFIITLCMTYSACCSSSSAAHEIRASDQFSATDHTNDGQRGNRIIPVLHPRCCTCSGLLLALSGGGQGVEFTSAFGGVAEVHGRTASAAFDANDPTETLAAKIAVMHNAAFPATAWCNPRDQGSTHETARVHQALVVSVAIGARSRRRS